MGAMKRLVGWNQSGWPIPQPLQALAGLVPFRPTAEELADRKAAGREAKAERSAIQAEPPTAPKPSAVTAARIAKAAVDLARFEAARTEMITAFREGVRAQIRAVLEGADPPTIEPAPAPGPEPVRYVQTTMF